MDLGATCQMGQAAFSGGQLKLAIAIAVAFSEIREKRREVYDQTITS